MRSVTRSIVNSRPTRSRAASPSLARSAGSRASSAMAAAIPATSPGSTRSPHTRWITTSSTPLTRVATTGSPAAIASRTALGKPSTSEDSTNTSAPASRSGTSLRAPENVTRSRRPRRLASSCSAAPSGPSPTNSSVRSSGGAPERITSCSIAASNTSWRFSGARRPTLMTWIRFLSGAPGETRASAGSSTPLGTRTTDSTLAPWARVSATMRRLVQIKRSARSRERTRSLPKGSSANVAKS